MATRITPDIKKQINERYLVLKTYAAVGRELGISPATVKRYVIPGYVPVADIKPIEVDTEAMRLRLETFVMSKEMMEDPWLLDLTGDERVEMEEYWKELAL